MVDDDHSACVSVWMERSAKDLTSERLLQVFEEAFAALWRRAHQTLGDVTLTAVVDRVIYNATELFPILSSLKVDTTGLRCGELREKCKGLNTGHLAEAIRFVLVELLTVLGNLTADILTPALHAELCKVTLGVTSRDEGRNSENEGKKS